MRIERVASIEQAKLHKLEKGGKEGNPDGTFGYASSEQMKKPTTQTSDDSFYEDNTLELKQHHLDEVKNITTFLEKMLNTPLVFNCLWVENLNAHRIVFLDADTDEVLINIPISNFVKFVDSYIFASLHGQQVSSLGNLFDIKV